MVIPKKHKRYKVVLLGLKIIWFGRYMGSKSVLVYFYNNNNNVSVFADHESVDNYLREMNRWESGKLLKWMVATMQFYNWNI